MKHTMLIIPLMTLITLFLTVPVAISGEWITETEIDPFTDAQRALISTLYEFGQVSACNRPIASSPADRPEGFLPTRYRALMLKNTRPSTGAAVPLPKRR